MRRNVGIPVDRTAYDAFVEELQREGYETTVEKTSPTDHLLYVRSPEGADVSIAEVHRGVCTIYPVMFAAPGGNPPY
jgi:hypothetical protein